MRIRRVTAAEWARVRALRLEALQDPVAAVAFLDTHQNASAQPDTHWQQRTTDAATSDGVAQFVADDGDGDGDGDWQGSVAVLVQRSGVLDRQGEFVDDRRAVLVGVYVRPAHRGSGLVGELIDRAADWVAAQGLAELFLEVHTDNPRAQAAYRRNGFRPTGRTAPGPGGCEVEMVRAVSPTSDGGSLSG